MTGDNLETDIKFGSNNSIDSLLVLTGCTRLEKAVQALGSDEQGEEGKPTFVQPFLGHSIILNNFE